MEDGEIRENEREKEQERARERERERERCVIQQWPSLLFSVLGYDWLITKLPSLASEAILHLLAANEMTQNQLSVSEMPG